MALDEYTALMLERKHKIEKNKYHRLVALMLQDEKTRDSTINKMRQVNTEFPEVSVNLDLSKDPNSNDKDLFKTN